jgi:hypothetical protein
MYEKSAPGGDSKRRSPVPNGKKLFSKVVSAPGLAGKKIVLFLNRLFLDGVPAKIRSDLFN